MSDKVIQAFPQREELPENILQVQRDPTLYCAHASIMLIEHDRAVQCVKCGAVLDPFNFLLCNGNHIQQAWQNHRMTAARVSALNESIDKLQREEKRLKALVKRLQDRSGAKLDTRGPL